MEPIDFFTIHYAYVSLFVQTVKNLRDYKT